MAENNGQEVDRILIELNPKGRYQLLQMIVALLGCWPAAVQLLGNVFICDPAPHRCAGTDNSSAYLRSLTGADNSSEVVYGECNITVVTQNGSSTEYPCMFGTEYENGKDLSAISQFDLVCDHKPLASLSQSLVIAGQGFGALLTTPVSDRLGRKLVLIVANLGLLTCGLFIAFSPTISVFILFKFLVGAFQQANSIVAITYTLELFPIKDRRLSAVFAGFMWALGVMLLPLMAFLLRDVSWRYLQVAYSGTSVFVILQIWYLDESLRWLMANGKSEKIENVLHRAAHTNGKSLTHIMEVYKRCMALPDEEKLALTNGVRSNGVTAPGVNLIDGMADLNNGVRTNGVTAPGINLQDGIADNKTVALVTKEHECDPEVNIDGVPEVTTNGVGVNYRRVARKMTIVDIFKNKKLLINAIIMWFTWFTVALGFFVLYLTATELAGDPYLNFFLVSLMELPSCVIFLLCLNRWGRKWTTFFLLSLLGVGLVLTGVFKYLGEYDTYQNLTLASSLLAMIGATGSFDAVFHYTPEMFPTNVRNQAMGVSSFISRIGGMLAPFIGILADQAIWAPGVLIGIMASVASLLLTLLPETKGRELPQTVEDLNNWYDKRQSVSFSSDDSDKEERRTKFSLRNNHEEEG